MKIRILCILSVFLSPTLSATAITEGLRLAERVEYPKHVSAEISCDPEYHCLISVRFGKASYAITQKMVGEKLGILPSGLALFYEHGGTTYNVEFEYNCDEYADKPPIYVCMANVGMHAGTVISISTFRRVYSDDGYENHKSSSPPKS